MNCKNIKYPILFSFLFFAGSIQGGYAQEASEVETGPDIQQASFTPPFDFPIVFSGNFGEIRANHFHGGLDFKTGGTIGKPVRALADGYISRIRVTHGSGYVLDVAYDNGYSTINRHLSAFVGDVARRVEDLQYEKESWEVEITPEPDEYPVKAGQIIALSGNTGYSFGPHLHLDMIETATDEYIDPLPFFMNKVKDKTAPCRRYHAVSTAGKRSGGGQADATGFSGTSNETHYRLGTDWCRHPCLRLYGRSAE